MKKLRHSSLHMHVIDICSRFHHHYLYIKRDITVQKMKVIK